MLSNFITLMEQPKSNSIFSIHTNEKETASLCPTSEDIMAAGISSVANGLSHLGSVLAE